MMHPMDGTEYASDLQGDRNLLAVAAGLVAAALGGLGWAAIVLLTDREIGWAAWGIGVLVGLAMSRATARRSRSLAFTAAALAVLGLLAGKAIVVTGSGPGLADELALEADYLSAALAWQLYEDRSLDPATLEAVDATVAAGDTLSDAVWADMKSEAATRLEVMGPDARRALAEDAARSLIRQLGLVGGIRAQLSGFDLLWMILAIGTAFRMMNAGAPAPVPAESTEADRDEREPVS